MRRRSLVSLAALLLAPALASAQPPRDYLGTREYAFAGCDYTHADLFGAGPRACGTAFLSIRDYSAGWSEADYRFTLTPYTGYLASIPVGIGFALNGISPDDLDGITFSACGLAVCRGGTTSLGGSFRVAAGNAPSAAFIGGSYVDDSIATGRDRFLLPPSARTAASLTLTATPEPATFALVAGGLAGLGVGLRVQRRRGKHVAAMPTRPGARA